jgi:hypothetical protein
MFIPYHFAFNLITFLGCPVQAVIFTGTCYDATLHPVCMSTLAPLSSEPAGRSACRHVTSSVSCCWECIGFYNSLPRERRGKQQNYWRFIWFESQASVQTFDRFPPATLVLPCQYSLYRWSVFVLLHPDMGGRADHPARRHDLVHLELTLNWALGSTVENL